MKSEQDDLFIFSEIIAFSGLSQREYFGSGLNYTNRDNFTMVIQSFKNPSGGVGITTRRRDGYTSQFFSSKEYKVIRPIHVHSNLISIELIDNNLITALLKVKETKDWPCFEEAIFSFNRANIDSDQVPEQAELILLNGAFERIFNLNHGKSKELAEHFTSIFKPNYLVKTEECNRIPQDQWDKYNSITEFWINDLFILRGNLSHGRKTSTYKSIWTLKEHLSWFLCLFRY